MLSGEDKLFPNNDGECHNLSLSLSLIHSLSLPAAALISPNPAHLRSCSHLHLICCNQASYKSPSSTLSLRQTVFTLMLRTPDLFPGLITRCRQVSFLTLPHTPDPRIDFTVSTSFCSAFARLPESPAVDPVPVFCCRVLPVLRCVSTWYLILFQCSVAESCLPFVVLSAWYLTPLPVFDNVSSPESHLRVS